MKKYIRYIIYFVLFILLFSAFIYLGKKDYGNDIKRYSDAERFSLEYSEIPTDNMFKYSYASQVLDILENGSGIIYMGFASNEWSKYYVKNLYQVLKDEKVSSVYYYDLFKDRLRSTKYYVNIEKKLDDYLYRLDDGSKRLNTPLLVIVKNGNILYVNNDTSMMENNIKPSSYWDYNRISKFSDEVSYYLESSGFSG